MPVRTTCAALAVLAAAAGANAVGTATAPLAFGRDLNAALDEASRRDRLVAVYFSSPRCTWCARMSGGTFTDDRVRRLMRRMLWVEAPSADAPALRARYGVFGYPCVVVLTGRDEEVARCSGYRPPLAFTAFLRRALASKARPVAETLEQLTAALKAFAEKAGPSDGVPRALSDAVEYLARPRRTGRRDVLDALAAAGPTVRPALCTLMGDKRLAIRAAAGSALAHVSGGQLPFDPFADKALRDKQVAAWRAWLRANPNARPAPEPERADPPPQGRDASTGTSRPASRETAP
ncbi:MAG: hypothetical protein KGY99_10420 [Phycisphaerae bacterium]|nr:hypothetical protein [Phycisphaerae bacterium]